MKEWGMRELGFGEILDVSFQTVKNNFSKMLMIMLILLAPASLYAFISYGTLNPLVIAIGIIINLVVYIFAMASVMLIVREVRQENEWDLGMIVRMAQSRFWPLLGSSICVGLLVTAIGFVYFLLFGILAGFSTVSLLSGSNMFDGMGFLGFVMIIAGICLIIFFSVRFSFYFPAVTYGEPAPGLSRSWHLTANYVWRLIGLFLVIYLIVMVVMLIPLSIMAVFFRFFVNSVFLIVLVQWLLSAISYMFITSVTAVIYFDLVIRNDAGDLRDLAAQYGAASTASQTVSPFGGLRTESGSDIPEPGSGGRVSLEKKESSEDKPS